MLQFLGILLGLTYQVLAHGLCSILLHREQVHWVPNSNSARSTTLKCKPQQAIYIADNSWNVDLWECLDNFGDQINLQINEHQKAKRLQDFSEPGNRTPAIRELNSQ